MANVVHITPKEAARMRRMGYTVKAVYKNGRGVPLTQFYPDGDFELFEEMRKAAGALELVGYAKL